MQCFFPTLLVSIKTDPDRHNNSTLKEIYILIPVPTNMICDLAVMIKDHEMGKVSWKVSIGGPM